MGRPKEFDRDDALMRAVHTFWAKGYYGTSVQDLVDAMGIHRASLYDTYGSKQDLFREVMERYSSHVLETCFPQIDGEGAVLDRLRNFFHEVVDDLCGDPRQCCLVVRTVASVADDMPVALELSARHVARVDARLAALLEQGQERGELDPALDAASLARHLRNTLHGLTISAAPSRDPQELREMVEWALGAVSRSGAQVAPPV